jgi:ABC-type transport system involved in multi-copper enzyme maturation permease subunit
MSVLRACTALGWVSFRRLLWSAGSLMILLPIGLVIAELAILGNRYASDDNFGRAFERFSYEFVILQFLLLVVPLCALTYATTSVGGDREDRTLLFLLVRPVPRPFILLAKMLATLPLVVGLTVAAFFVCCELAGAPGQAAFEVYLPTMLLMSISYVAAFHLFAVYFRHATVLALIYSIFMEFFLSNIPGMVQRFAVNFYGRSMIYDYGTAYLVSRGDSHVVEPVDPRIFTPVTAETAFWSLSGLTAAAMVAAAIVFQRREYRDLT